MEIKSIAVKLLIITKHFQAKFIIFKKYMNSYLLNDYI